MNIQKELLDLNWKKHFEKVKNNLQIDQGSRNESCLGLTLLVRIPEELHQLISPKIQQLKAKYHNQFFYPIDRIHLTITGLIPVKENIKINDRLLEKLIPLIKDTLEKYASFEVKLIGLNITNTSIFIQGFYPNNTLDELRKDLITKIQIENLDLNLAHLSSFDLGYAWLTIMRFINQDASNLLEEIKELRNFEFGKFTINELQLVTTDKYFSEENTKVIRSFCL